MLTQTFAVGDVVTLTKDGAEFGREGSIESTTGDTNKRGCFMEGMRGNVIDERNDGNFTEYAVYLIGDEVPGRAWWMCCDEIVKEA